MSDFSSEFMISTYRFVFVVVERVAFQAIV